jgi:hypothetical protein
VRPAVSRTLTAEKVTQAMHWSRVKVVSAVMGAAIVAGSAVPAVAQAPPAAAGGKAPNPSADQFDRVTALVRPLPGEYAWRDEIPWEARIQTARIKAAAEDKPILILASANAFALGRT